MQQCCKANGPQLRIGSTVRLHLPQTRRWPLCGCALVPLTMLLCSTTGLDSRHCPRSDLSNKAQGIASARHSPGRS